MNTAIYATILTGLGIVITLIVTMHNLAKANQQETNRRIDELRQDINRRIDKLRHDANRRTDDLKKDLKELLEVKFKVNDSQFELVNVKVQKLDGEVADARQELQDIKRVIFKPAA